MRIVDRGHHNAARNLSVEVYENPEAIIFKGTHEGVMHATICADCGNVELTVTNAADLYNAYLLAQRNSPPT